MHYMGLKELGSKLRDLRENKGLNQADLSHLASVAKNTIGELEKGNGNPTVETIASLETALGDDSGALFRAYLYRPPPEVAAPGTGRRLMQHGPIQADPFADVAELLNLYAAASPDQRSIVNGILRGDPAYFGDAAPQFREMLSRQLKAGESKRLLKK